jgi:hypothetical protein
VRRPIEINFLILLELFIAMSVVVYWSIWFTNPALLWLRFPGALDFAVYANHRQGDFLAAVWLALSALIGGLGLWQRRNWGFLFTLLTGGTTFTLGLASLLFNLQNQLFAPFTAAAGLELIFLIMMLVFGPLSILLVWRYRRRFIR